MKSPAGMMRWACTIRKFRRHFCSAIRSLWVSLPSQWPEMLHQATTVSLWKLKGSPGDLNYHRGICLISLWGRVLGPYCGSKTCSVCGTRDFGHDTVGIQRSSTRGAPAVARRVLDAATKPFGSTGAGPVLCGTSGFEESNTRTRLGTPFTQ